MPDIDDPNGKQDPQVPDQLAEPVDVNLLDWPQVPLRVEPAGAVDVNVKSGAVDVTLQGTPAGRTDVQGFWEYLRQRTDAIAFDKYEAYIANVLCATDETTTKDVVAALDRLRDAARVNGMDAYQLLRVATEAFLLVNCGTVTNGTAGRLGDIGTSTRATSPFTALR